MSPWGPDKLEQMQQERRKLQVWQQQGQGKNQLPRLRPPMPAPQKSQEPLLAAAAAAAAAAATPPWLVQRMRWQTQRRLELYR